MRFFADPRGRSCRECTSELKRLRNCDGSSNPHFRELWQGEVARRCPLAEITPFSFRMLRDFRRYREHGLLPRSGGAGDQDAKTMAAIEAVEISFVEENPK